MYQIYIQIRKKGRISSDNLPLRTLEEQDIQKVKLDLESLFCLKLLLISKGLYINQFDITT